MRPSPIGTKRWRACGVEYGSGDRLPHAIADQDNILEYLAREAGIATAEKYDAAFRALLSRLAVFPGLGAPRPELGEGIRTYVLHPYVVIYEGGPGSETAVIHRIVHGRRDMRADIIKS
jgi:toxin ParE1/3/4